MSSLMAICLNLAEQFTPKRVSVFLSTRAIILRLYSNYRLELPKQTNDSRSCLTCKTHIFTFRIEAFVFLGYHDSTKQNTGYRVPVMTLIAVLNIRSFHIIMYRYYNSTNVSM